MFDLEASYSGRQSLVSVWHVTYTTLRHVPRNLVWTPKAQVLFLSLEDVDTLAFPNL